jgi:hypothetical protein
MVEGIVDSGEWRVESGEWRVESGEWRVESGEWRVESGEWRVESENVAALWCRGEENQRAVRGPRLESRLVMSH